MWLLLGVSATGFFIGYKARMSYGREHKEAGLAVRPLVQRGTSLAFREVPAQAVLFYAGMLPQNGAEGSGILVFPLSHPSTPECGEIVFQGRTIEVRLCGAP
jgi:hypothetical protein